MALDGFSIGDRVLDLARIVELDRPISEIHYGGNTSHSSGASLTFLF
jgi:hypothetical protein